MDRRAFLGTLAGGVLAAPLAAEAQQAGTVPRIGILSPAPPAASAGAPFDAFRDAMRQLGYIDGRSVRLEFRFGAGYARLPELAAELARLPVDVIVTDGGDATARAALKVSKTIPIVMGTASADPVAAGLVKSLARPGGTITGFMLSYNEIAGKRLQLLKEMVPTVTRIGVLWDPIAGGPQLRAAEAAAPSLGVQLVPLTARTREDLDAAFEEARRQRVGALLQLSSRMLFDNQKAIVERSLAQRLPGMFELAFVSAGALAAYGVSVSDNFRAAAGYVDKILKGARPGDLPIEQPTKFELVINLKAAKALGLTIPPALLQRADQVIE